MTKPGSKYCQLQTMDELANARRKIRRMKAVNEVYLEQDWQELKYRLSPSTILEQARERMLCSSPMLQKIVAGARVGLEMMRRRRARREGNDCGCGM